MSFDSVNEVIDNSPNSVWNSRKTNTVLEKLDHDISTGLDSQTLSINGTQTVLGQKTFSNLYITDTSAVSYERMLGYLQNDISPQTNTGAKGISTDISKELSFSKDNVSGVVSSISRMNPVYRNSDIYIGWGVSGSLTIDFSCNNIPIPKVGLPFPASTSSHFQIFNQTNNIENYLTSINISGTVNISSTSVLNNSYGISLIGYVTDTLKSGVALYVSSTSIGRGVAGFQTIYMSETSGNIIGYKRLGFFLSTSSIGNTFINRKQVTSNNNHYFLNQNLNPKDIYSLGGAANGLGFIIDSDIIMEYQCFDNTIDLGNPSFTPSFKLLSPLYNFDILAFGIYSQRTKQVKLPLKLDKLTGQFIVNRDSRGNVWQTDTYLIQNSARVMRITYI